MNTHEAIPRSQTCHGDSDCRGHRKTHPKFYCTCGAWYATERGLRAHVAGQVSFVPVAEAQEMAGRAGMTLTKFCKSAGDSL